MPPVFPIHFLTHAPRGSLVPAARRLLQEAQRSGWFETENLASQDDGGDDDMAEEEEKDSLWGACPPGLLLRRLSQLPEGDMLLYMHAECQLNTLGEDRFWEYLRLLQASTSSSLRFQLPYHSEKDYTEPRVFEGFGVDQTNDVLVRQSGQLIAEVLVVKNDEGSRAWLQNILDALSKAPLATTSPGFPNSRGMQSVMSVSDKLLGTSLILSDETYPDGQLQFPFWVHRRQLTRTDGRISICSESMGSWMTHVYELLRYVYASCDVLEDKTAPDVVVVSCFPTVEPPWNQKMVPYIFASGETYDVSSRIPDEGHQTLGHLPEARVLEFSTVHNTHGDKIHLPFVLCSPYLYLDRKYTNTGDRPFDVAYCNSNPVPFRQELYRTFVKSGLVCHALGRDNAGLPETHKPIGGSWESSNLMDTYQNYTFVFAMENSQDDGYITEKIVNAFHAGSIPIYWGCRDVGAHFNKEAFVDVSDFSSLEACVEFVRNLQPEDISRMASVPFLRDDSDLVHLLDYQRPNTLRSSICHQIYNHIHRRRLN